MKIKKSKIAIFLLWALCFSGAVGILFFTTVDRTPYNQTDFYSSTIIRLDSLAKVIKQQEQQQSKEQEQLQEQPQVQLQTHSQTRSPRLLQDSTLHMDTRATLNAGWGRTNITPPQPVRLTGKNFKPYQQIYDSVFVRTFMFDNQVNRVLLINYDLWIMHPTLANAVRNSVFQEFPEITGIYFTANHSHTSIGGWASGLLGSLVVGGNSEETLDYAVRQTLQSIRIAKQSMEAVRVGFGAISTEGLVANRLDPNGYVDKQLRVLELENGAGSRAVFNTYSAHSVYMDKDINTLSADYPGAFLEYLVDQETVEFAAFAPGATGSHSPVRSESFELKKMLAYSRNLAAYFNDLQGNIETKSTNTLKYFELPVDLRSPHFRISNGWRFRPWVFEMIMGKMNPKITVLRIGNTVLVGLPVELSGEFYPEFDAICQQRGLSLMITSFNGWYLGYVNPEKYYYSLRKAETRDMNWFGPQNGEYFVELVQRILEIV